MSKPIIPWIGGKRRLARHILPLFGDHRCYCEPFCGGAALFFMKEPSPVEVLNDLNGEVVNLYRVVQHHLDEFVRQFRWSLASRKIYGWLRNSNPDPLTDIQRAARFFYLQKLAFGGKVQGRTFGTAATSPPRLNLLRIEEDLSQAHLRLTRVCLESLTWQQCMAKYDRPQTLFYLDPPYWQTEGYGLPFGFEQYEEMATTMAGLKGRAILSINDHPDMRRVFKDFSRDKVGITYTVGGGKKSASRQELIIKSW